MKKVVFMKQQESFHIKMKWDNFVIRAIFSPFRFMKVDWNEHGCIHKWTHEKYILKPVFKTSAWAERCHSVEIKREENSMAKFYLRD